MADGAGRPDILFAECLLDVIFAPNLYLAVDLPGGRQAGPILGGSSPVMI